MLRRSKLQLAALQLELVSDWSNMFRLLIAQSDTLQEDFG